MRGLNVPHYLHGVPEGKESMGLEVEALHRMLCHYLCHEHLW